MSRFRGLVYRCARRAGLSVCTLDHTLGGRRNAQLTKLGITTVLDVGANSGQYASELRRGGFRGTIISFEPVTAAFNRLASNTARDRKHHCHRLALGDVDGSTIINVSRDLVGSSLLRPSDLCVEAHPSAVCVAEETVPVRRLDSITGTLLPPEGRLYLKLDTQGYELEVLRGACTTLARVHACEVEVSLRPLYSGQSLLPDVFAFLNERGFHAVWAERGLLDQSGDMLQLDVLFAR